MHRTVSINNAKIAVDPTRKKRIIESNHRIEKQHLHLEGVIGLNKLPIAEANMIGQNLLRNDCVHTGTSETPMSSTVLEVDKHAEFIRDYEKKQDPFEAVVTEHLKLNGIYWGLTGRLCSAARRNGPCRHPGLRHVVRTIAAGSVATGHDPHLLYTVCGANPGHVRRTWPYRRRQGGRVRRGCRTRMARLRRRMGEVDTRFSYCALSCLSLLGRLHDLMPACRRGKGGAVCGTLPQL